MVIVTLLPIQHLLNGSWSHHLGQNKTGYTFGQVYKCLTPSNRERLITISRSDSSDPAPALEGKLRVIHFHWVHPNSCVGRFLKVLYDRKWLNIYIQKFRTWKEGRAAAVWNELLSFMHAFSIHANVGNKTALGVSSTSCRCEEAETKAAVTLMASLVIRRPLMYALHTLFYPPGPLEQLN